MLDARGPDARRQVRWTARSSGSIAAAISVTNIDRRTFSGFASSDSVVIQIAGRDIARVISTYADAGPGGCALFGSSIISQLALNGASAAAFTGATGKCRDVGRRA